MARKSKKKKPARKPKAKKPKAKGQRPKAKNVWHIFHFAERFELPAAMQACRQGPLQFLKLPVAGDPYDNESHILGEQWAMLDREDNTLILEAVLIRLWKHAGRRSRKYRGYLLNEHYQPMTTAQIARIFDMGVSESAGVLGTLKKYNLIERVAMPDFSRVPDEPPEEKGHPQKGTKDKEQKPKKTDADGTAGSAAKRAVPVSPLDIDKLCRGGMDFADQVFVMLFERQADTGRLIDRRELGAIAGAWNRALLAKLKPTRLNELWEKSVNMKKADIRRLKKAAKPGAAWMKIFNGRLQGMTPKKVDSG